MKRLLPILMILAGCETAPTSADVYARYQNKPVGLIEDRWGVPDRVVQADGGKIYMWRPSEQGGSCRFEVHANERGNVIGIKRGGDDAVCGPWLRRL